MAERGEQVALRTRGGERELTWTQYDAGMRRLAARLHALGLRRGDPLALMLRNRPEFHLADAAAMHLGAIPFSIYNTSSPEQVEFVVRDSGARIAIAEDDFRERVPAEQVLTPEELDGVEPTPGLDLDAAWQAVEPQDTLTLIYTSGTTGDPKAVELTHANMVFAMRGYDAVIGFPDGGDVVSYLPMAHIAERNCSHYFPMGFGFRVTCCPDAREVIAYLPEVRPAWFFAVPRIWEKLKAGLEAKGVRQAIEAGDEATLAGIRAQLGLDRAKAVNVGAAPTPPEVIEFFHALGLPLGELWGMSETTAIGACNPPEKIKIGTVGPAVPGVRLRLADDGEIEVSGPCVTPGYRGRPDLTREAFTDRRLAAHRRHRRARRGRLPVDRRPQEGADHLRGRQEHVAGQHREPAEGGQPADRLRGRDRRPPPLQRRADRARSRRRRARRTPRPRSARRSRRPTRRCRPSSRSSASGSSRRSGRRAATS